MQHIENKHNYELNITLSMKDMMEISSAECRHK